MGDDSNSDGYKLARVPQVEGNADGQSVDEVVEERTNQVQVASRMLHVLHLLALGSLQLSLLHYFRTLLLLLIIFVPVLVVRNADFLHHPLQQDKCNDCAYERQRYLLVIQQRRSVCLGYDVQHGLA